MRNKLSDAIKLANKSALMLGSVAAVAMMGFAATANAQDDAAAEPEEVVVTGIRGALQQSVDIKRNSVGTVDAVSAEDVGKFPDKNVAESLSRIPGVSSSGQFGEADKVSIRGASNTFTFTQLNGQNVASTGWYSQQPVDRSFNYTLLPSELIAGMEVYKSSQADLVEGGVGGTVNVKTRKPLDMDANSGVLSVKGTYASGSEETDPEFSGLYSFKNDAETIGVLVAAAQSDYSLVRKGFEATPTWNQYIAPVSFHQTKEREALNVVAQFRPTDALEFGINYMDLTLGANGVNQGVWIAGAPGAGDPACQVSHQNVPVYCEHKNGSSAPSYFDSRSRQAEMTSETVDAWFTYTAEAAKLETRFGTTEATGGTSFENSIWAGIDLPTKGITDFRGDTARLIGNFDSSISYLPTSGAFLDMSAVVKQPNEDQEDYFQADLTFDLDLGPLTSIKTGVRQTEHTAGARQYKYNGNYKYNAADGYEKRELLTDGLIAGGTDQDILIPKTNAKYLDAITMKIAGNNFAEDRSGYKSLTEENTSLYVMGNFEVDGVRGNLGFRYIQTDASSEYYVPGVNSDDATGLPVNKGFTTTLATDKASYDDVLPSFNVAFDLTDDLILRASAAKVITRSNFNDMYATTSVAGLNDNNPNNGTATRGNIGLLPYTSNQADVGLEWYFSEGSVASAAYFNKTVTNFVVPSVSTGVSIGVPDGDKGGADSWTTSSSINGKTGTIEGLELQFQHTFENGFGGVINYTFADAKADPSNYADNNSQMTDSSKNTFNLVGFYETDTYSLRAAYNWKSEYWIREYPGFYGNRVVQDAGTLDLSANWHVLDNVTVTFDATNVLGEDFITIGRDNNKEALQGQSADGIPGASYEGESRYSVGLSYRF